MGNCGTAFKRSLAWKMLLVALGSAAFVAQRTGAQTPTSEPLPAGVAACQFEALSNPPNGGPFPAIRNAPRGDANVLGLLATLEITNADFTESRREIPPAEQQTSRWLADFQVTEIDKWVPLVKAAKVKTD